MTQAEKEQLLETIETKIGLIRAFAPSQGIELIELHNYYKNGGASITELQLFLDDCQEFIKGERL